VWTFGHCSRSMRSGVNSVAASSQRILNVFFGVDGIVAAVVSAADVVYLPGQTSSTARSTIFTALS
jgi:hypothetical protein